MDNDAVAMRYLLGKLSDSEAARLEERYFAEDSVFQEIETAEDELVDAYVRGSLSPEDRQRFEAKVLDSERLAERVEFARLLAKLPSSQMVGLEPARVSWWKKLFDFSWPHDAAIRGALVSSVFLLLVGLPAFIWMRVRDERRLETERAAIEYQKQQVAQQLAAQQSKTKELATELQNSKAEEERLQRQLQTAQDELARTNAQPAAPASILLFAISARGPGEAATLTVPSNASTIKLQLALDSEDYSTYQATIKAPGDPNVLTRPGLKPSRSGRARIIVWQFAARLLSSGDYVVSLSGLTPSGTYERVADYPVRISRK